MNSGKRKGGGSGDALLADLMRFKPDEMTPNGWAVAAGVSRAVWGDIRRHGNPSRRTLEKLLDVSGSSLAEFEALRVGDARPQALVKGGSVADRSSAWRTAGSPQLGSIDGRASGLASRLAIFTMDQPLPTASESLQRRFEMPVTVANMEPRFRLGRMIVVDAQSPCRPGDDVLVGLSEEVSFSHRRYLLAHLVERTDQRLVLRQFSPPGDFELDRGGWSTLYKVLGEKF